LNIYPLFKKAKRIDEPTLHCKEDT
jgi:hypothetical protein